MARIPRHFRRHKGNKIKYAHHPHRYPFYLLKPHTASSALQEYDAIRHRGERERRNQNQYRSGISGIVYPADFLSGIANTLRHQASVQCPNHEVIFPPSLPRLLPRSSSGGSPELPAPRSGPTPVDARTCFDFQENLQSPHGERKQHITHQRMRVVTLHHHVMPLPVLK